MLALVQCTSADWSHPEEVMIIVPMRSEAPAPTRRSRELASRLEEAIREYRRQEPGLTESEVRAAAASLATPDEDAVAAIRRRQVIAVSAAAVLAVLGVVLSATSGGDVDGNTASKTAMPVIAALIGAIAVVAAVLRIRARR